LLRLRVRLLIPLMCFVIAVPIFAQTGASMTMSREDQLTAAAPATNGQTGLFTTVTADTLHHGDLSFGVYYQGWRLEAAPAPLSLRPPSARDYKDMGYELTQLSASLGYGLTDRWEVSVMAPYERIKGSGGDRVGFVNGYLYSGRFSESGMGDVTLGLLVVEPAPERAPNQFHCVKPKNSRISTSRARIAAATPAPAPAPVSPDVSTTSEPAGLQ